MSRFIIIDPNGLPLSFTEGELQRAFGKAFAAITAADALADAVETFLNWTDPYDYEGVAQARRAVPAALMAYREARK